MKTRSTTLGLMTISLITMLILSACGNTSTGAVNNGTGTFTPADVLAATGVYKVIPVYAVPKQLKKKYTLAFINPGESVPFFKTWSQGMQAAAKFYGVNYLETDVQLHFENELTAFQTLSVKNPDVVGTLPGDPALFAATQAAHIPLITMDSQVQGDPYSFGVPNDQFGALAGTQLAKAAQQKLQGVWQGKNVVFVGLNSQPCDPCQQRVVAGQGAVQQTFTISSQNIVIVNAHEGGTDHPQSTMADVITAHPHDVFVVLPINDEFAVGSLLALQAANRLNDALVVSLGCDSAGQDALRNADYKKSLIGCVDSNPYAEGWNWIEAAIATAQGNTFAAYQIRRFITPDQIDQVYPKS